jgi:sec-independent protein translocase protein TatA
MHTPLFLFLEGIGGGEMMIVLVVVLIFFGANKIPELARGLGKGIREFKDASREIRSEFENAGQPNQQPYQQQFNQRPNQDYAPPAAPTAAPVSPVATPVDGTTAPDAPAERPRFDQMS